MFSDNAIVKYEEDIMDRSDFCNRLAQTILEIKDHDTFIFGLYGKWGSGKTSIINLTKDKINSIQSDVTQDKKLVVIDYAPWNFTNTSQLISQFFIQLSSVFKNKKDKLDEIGQAIEKYSCIFDPFTLIPGPLGTISAFSQSAFNTTAKLCKKTGNNLFEQKNIITNLLIKQEKRILFIIDDLDRLSNEQIRQVFQLVTSIANFPNITYLLSFDKDVVVKALEAVQEGRGEEYLKKIIQVPIVIPLNVFSSIRSNLISKLNDCIEKKSYTKDDEYFSSVLENCIRPFIKDIRDINRLCNCLKVKLKSDLVNINISDMVALTTLETFCSNLIEWIYTNKSILVGYIFNESKTVDKILYINEIKKIIEN